MTESAGLGEFVAAGSFLALRLERRSCDGTGAGSQLRTHPSWRCEGGTAEPSPALSCCSMLSPEGHQQATTISLHLSCWFCSHKRFFQGVEEVVVFFSVEGMSCSADPALGSGINSSVVSHMKITPEGITGLTIFQLKGRNCRLELRHPHHVCDGARGDGFCYLLTSPEEILAICPVTGKALTVLA